MRKILIITEAGDANPSGKIRAHIYKDLFLANGYHVRFKSCSSPFIVKINFSVQNNSFISFLKKFGIIGFLNFFNARIYKKINLFFLASYSRKFDIIYLQKIYSWPFIQTLSARKTARLVYDLNDGLWLPVFERLTNGNIKQIIGAVDAVISDNPYGVAFAKKINKNSFMVPDSPQVEMFDIESRKKETSDQTIVLGWVGSPGTLYNLYVIFEALESLFKRFKNIHLRILGSGFNQELLPSFENVRYSVKPFYTQKELVDEVLKMDIGLFPLFDIENSLARGILKATVYMSGEVATVCSSVGQSKELIKDGINGMLAATSGDWEEKLSVLITDAEARKNIARRGHETIKTEFTLEKNFQKLIDVLLARNLG